MKLQLLSSALTCCALANSTRAQSCDPAFPGERSLPMVHGANAFALHDFNGDGHADLVTCGSWAVHVWLAQGGGEFGVAMTTAIPNASRLLDVADWNADGALDLAIDITTSSYNPSVKLLLSNGDGTFTDASTLTTGPNLQSVTHGDLDGDGVVDLLVGLFGAYQVAFGVGGGVFKTHPVVAHGSVITSYLLGDLDQDGDLDAVALAVGRVFLNSGIGQFGAPLTIPQSNGAVLGLLADIEGDGDLDLITARESPATIQVHSNDGSGGFVPVSAVPLATYLRRVAAHDLDRDGLLDLVGVGAQPGGIFVLAGQPQGGFAAPQVSAISAPYFVAELCDIDSDGALDVPFVSELTLSAGYARGDGAGGFSSVSRSPFPIYALETALAARGESPVLRSLVHAASANGCA